ncbi:MAG: YezD family protein [Methylococcaceae bacterium]|jgi:hypothetical protein
MTKHIETPPFKDPVSTDLVARIYQMLNEIKFGSVEIVIHDGKVVQIERKEKLRPLG